MVYFPPGHFKRYVTLLPPQYGNSDLKEPYCPEAEGQYGSWRSEFPYCSQLRWEEWHSIFSIAFWNLKVRFDKTGLACSDSMEIPSRLASYQVWHSIQCKKIECLDSLHGTILVEDWGRNSPEVWFLMVICGDLIFSENESGFNCGLKRISEYCLISTVNTKYIA